MEAWLTGKISSFLLLRISSNYFSYQTIQNSVRYLSFQSRASQRYNDLLVRLFCWVDPPLNVRFAALFLFGPKESFIYHDLAVCNIRNKTSPLSIIICRNYAEITVLLLLETERDTSSLDWYFYLASHQ